MKRILILIIISLQAGLAFSQQFLNFDFEKESVEGLSRPWGWNLDAWGSNVFSLDTVNVSSGRFSLKLQSDSVATQLPSLQHNVEPFFIKGKLITLKGSINSQLTKGKTIISIGFASLDNENSYSDSSSIIYENTQRTKGWEKFDVSFTIPKNVTSTFLKIGFEGQGTVWYDNLEIYVEDVKYEEVPVANCFSDSEVEWIEKNAIPFGSIKETTIETVDFDFLQIGNSRIVALGESTHGTSEFFTLKHQVFKYLVNQLGFRVFALEDNQLACEKVNQYVLGKLGVATEEAMSNLFAVWYTEEMKSLIEWIKEWNTAYPEDPVYFTGFDMQDYKLPLRALKGYLTKRDTTLLSQLNGFETFANNIFSANDSIKSHWVEKTNFIYNKIKKQIDSSKQEIIHLQNANLIRQFSENALKGHWSLYRDEAMAENITWLANKVYPDKRIFVWAHDVHVSQSYHPNELHNLNNGIAMGNFLRNAFGNDYKSYGLMTYSGAYLALKSYTNYERIDAPLYLAPKGSLEEALHQVSNKLRETNLFLDFKNTKEWLKNPLPFRFANHVNVDYGFWQRISVPYQFDGIFFIDETNPSEYLNKK